MKLYVYTILPFLMFAKVYAADLAVNWNELGYYRIANVSPPLAVADPEANAGIIIEFSKKAYKQKAHVVGFPELSLVGYTSEHHLLNSELIDSAKTQLNRIRLASLDMKGMVIIVGAPLRGPNRRTYNAGVVISDGKILGAVPKQHLPNYSEFRDKLFFDSGENVDLNVNDSELGSFRIKQKQIFKFGSLVFGLDVCEDLFAMVPPSVDAAKAGANFIFNLSASPERMNKPQFRRNLLEQHSSRLIVGYAYVSSGPMESSRDVVYSGHSMIYENGAQLGEAKRFQREGTMLIADVDTNLLNNQFAKNGTNRAESTPAFDIVEAGNNPHALSDLRRKIDSTPFVPKGSTRNQSLRDVLDIQAHGLVQRMKGARVEKLVIGVSGGLDSAWALVVATEAMRILKLPNSNIIGVTMPGPGTSSGTKSNAIILMESFGVDIKVIPISEQHLLSLSAINADPNDKNLTFENSQARIRTENLMNLAGKLGAIVVGTGDLSEICVGFCTFNGDQTSHYGVNSGAPKTLLQALTQWYATTPKGKTSAKVLLDIIGTPISPELLPPVDGVIQQVTEHILGPYEVQDFITHCLLENNFSPKKIFHLSQLAFGKQFSNLQLATWLERYVHRFSANRFKSTNQPPGPKVVSVSISPRELRFPDDIRCSYLLNPASQIKKQIEGTGQ